MIGRRQALGWIVAAPALAGGGLRAQTLRRARHVAVIAPSPEQLPKFPFFEGAMRERSAAAGFAVDVQTRFANSHGGGAAGVVAEALAARPDVVIAANTPIVHAVMAARSDIPVVMAVVGDREGAGVVRQAPGQNVTGVTTLVAAMAAKRLALLKEAAPGIAKVLALHHPDDPIAEPQLRDLAAAGPALGVTLRTEAVREPVELDRIFAEAAGWGSEAVFRLAGQSARTLRRTIELSRGMKLPSMHVLQDDARQGGLMAYYASFEEHWERVAALVDRILRGTPARDLPVEQPTRFELVINQKTAAAIGIKVPHTLVFRADDIFE